MKRLMATGGLIGFGGGVLLGLMTEGATWPGLLWRASVSALVAGLLFRWLGGVWISCLQEAHWDSLANQQQNTPHPHPAGKSNYDNAC